MMFLFQVHENHGKLSLSPVVTLLSVSSVPCSPLPSCYSLLNHKNVVSILNATEFAPKVAFCGTFHHCLYPVG